MEKRAITPPFDQNSALEKVRMAQDLWNTRDPEKVALAYTEDCQWRNRAEFLSGRDAIKAFLSRKWSKELDYRLRKELFLFSGEQIAVRFQYEWHDEQSHWFRSYGIELWNFASDGRMYRREASINDLAIEEAQREIF